MGTQGPVQAVMVSVKSLESNSDGNYALVTDSFGVARSVTTDIVRTGRTPQIGEKWIIDQAFGPSWTFAAYVATTVTGNAALPIAQALGSADLDLLMTPGSYFQNDASLATTALHYPVAGVTGLLTVESSVGTYVDASGVMWTDDFTTSVPSDWMAALGPGEVGNAYPNGLPTISGGVAHFTWPWSAGEDSCYMRRLPGLVVGKTYSLSFDLVSNAGGFAACIVSTTLNMRYGSPYGDPDQVYVTSGGTFVARATTMYLYVEGSGVPPAASGTATMDNFSLTRVASASSPVPSVVQRYERTEINRDYRRTILPSGLWSAWAVSVATGSDASLSTLALTSTADASPSTTGHPFQIGPSAGLNLRADAAEILAANNGVGSKLTLNASGGDVTLGDSNATVLAPGFLRLPKADDASLTSTTHAFQIGSTNDVNLIIDNNEIVARNNGANSTLFLNTEIGGGAVSIGNATSVVTIAGLSWGRETVTATSVVGSGTFQFDRRAGVVTLSGAITYDTTSIGTDTEIDFLNSGGIPLGYRPNAAMNLLGMVWPAGTDGYLRTAWGITTDGMIKVVDREWAGNGVFYFALTYVSA